MHKKTKYLFLFFISFILLWILGFYFSVNWATNKISKKLSKLDYILNIENKGLSGLKSFHFENIVVSNKQCDTILQLDSLEISIRLLSLFIGQIRVSELNIGNIDLKLHLLKTRSSINTNPEDPNTDYQAFKYNEKIKHLFNYYFSFIPAKTNITSIKIAHHSDSLDYSFSSFNFRLKNNRYSGTVIFSDQNKSSKFNVKGNIDPTYKSFDIFIKDTSHQIIVLPGFSKKLEFTSGIDSIYFSLKFNKTGKFSEIFTHGYATRLYINSQKIASKPVVIDTTEFDLNIIFSENKIETDSMSTLTLNKLKIKPKISFEKTKDSRLIRLEVSPITINSADLFESLPSNLFQTLSGIKTSGQLSYQLKFELDLLHPDSIKLDSRLSGTEFTIKRYGNENFTKLNETFFHQIVVNGVLIDSFRVGPENPNFVYLNEISLYLRNCVLTAEDGSFFYHKGFNEEAFANSISSNIKERRFARGGSTISMQLIKNVFLSRNKTVSRKLEEMLIVWLIENQHLVSKERMYEVYLNIIEWAPGIYGIKKASYFYFKKHPGELDLAESIYLSALVPRPKYFKHTFNKHGEMREYFKYFYQVLPQKMINVERITPEDTIGLSYNININGIASSLLEKQDSIALTDTLFIQQ